ncbi:MAG: SpoIVB peptidase [Clostridiales bacterium]|nr:SpoIVB peptidase [Clostridiales bacterium]
MKAKNGGRRLLTALCCICVLTGAAAAVGKLVPVGRAVGIKLHADGVMVASVEAVQTAVGQISPAEQAGVRPGDVILAVDGDPVDTNDGLQEKVAASGGRALTLRVRRDDGETTLTVTPVQDKGGAYRLGVMIRDGMAGIGTITYVDPETGAYGSLGHGICDGDSGALVPLQEGSLMEAAVAGVTRGQSGAPGALQGEFNLQEDMGTVERNTACGIFGRLFDDRYYRGASALPVASTDEIKPGPCEIWANVEGETVRHYAAEISKVFPAGGEYDRCLLIHVTDPSLLARTGGIVQGMSGSPIVQDGRLVGAVTHVLVGDPTRGYAVQLSRMLEAAEEGGQRAA